MLCHLTGLRDWFPVTFVMYICPFVTHQPPSTIPDRYLFRPFYLLIIVHVWFFSRGRWSVIGAFIPLVFVFCSRWLFTTCVAIQQPGSFSSRCRAKHSRYHRASLSDVPLWTGQTHTHLIIQSKFSIFFTIVLYDFYCLVMSSLYMKLFIPISCYV